MCENMSTLLSLLKKKKVVEEEEEGGEGNQQCFGKNTPRVEISASHKKCPSLKHTNGRMQFGTQLKLSVYY